MVEPLWISATAASAVEYTLEFPLFCEKRTVVDEKNRFCEERELAFRISCVVTLQTRVIVAVLRGRTPGCIGHNVTAIMVQV